MAKRKEMKSKSSLSSMQEMLYTREFKRADKAAGYTNESQKNYR